MSVSTSVSSSPSSASTTGASMHEPDVDVELFALCTALETALLSRTGGIHTPPCLNVGRAVRLSIPSAGISLTPSQSQRVRRACGEPGGLPALLRAIGVIASLPPEEVARRILRTREKTASSSPRKTNSPRRMNAVVPLSPTKSSPRSPVLLSVLRFNAAFQHRVVTHCVHIHRELWTEVFERYAEQGRWNMHIFTNVVRQAALHKGPLSKVLQVRVECIAENGWDQYNSLKSVAFVALHRARNGPQRLSAAELPPVVENALKEAFAALAVDNVPDHFSARSLNSDTSMQSVASTPETVSPLPIVRAAEDRTSVEGGKRNADVDDDDDDDDHAFAAMVNIPLRASIGHVLQTSAEKREHEIQKVRALAHVLNGKDEIAELKEEIVRLRETVAHLDQRKQRQWGVASVLGLVALSAGLVLSAVVAAVAAEAAGVFGATLPFVEHDYSVFI